MQLLTFSGESQGAEVFRHDIPADLRDEAELWREQMLEQLFEFSNELAERVLEKEHVPEELVRQVLRDATLHRLIVPVLCGSALDYIGIQPLLDAVTLLSAQPGRQAPGRRHQPQEARRAGDPQAVGGRAVLRPGVQDRRRQARRPALRARLFGRAEGRQPGVQPGQGQEGKHSSVVAYPGRSPRAGRPASGRRHRRADWPQALDHRRHALRRAAPDPARNDRLSRKRSSRWRSSPKVRPSARSWAKCWR